MARTYTRQKYKNAPRRSPCRRYQQFLRSLLDSSRLSLTDRTDRVDSPDGPVVELSVLTALVREGRSGASAQRVTTSDTCTASRSSLGLLGGNDAQCAHRSTTVGAIWSAVVEPASGLRCGRRDAPRTFRPRASRASIRGAELTERDARAVQELQVVCSPISVLPLKQNLTATAIRGVFLVDVEGTPVGYCISSRGTSEPDRLYLPTRMNGKPQLD